MQVGIIWNEISTGLSRGAAVDRRLTELLVNTQDASKAFRNYFKDFKANNVKYFQSPAGIINTDDSLVDPDHWHEFDALFILAELNWNNHERTSFQGISLLQKIRLEGVKCPVFICSFMPERALIVQYKKRILGFRGHYFLQVPDAYQNNAMIEPLDDLELEYCKMHLCNVEGGIRDIFHTKQRALSKGLDEGKRIIRQIFSDILALPLTPEGIRERIHHSIKQVDEISSTSELQSLIRQDESFMLDYFSEQSNETTITVRPKGNWKILMLEDVPDDLEQLRAALETAGMKNRMIIAASYDEACRLISEDKNNFIAAVVSDYRLFNVVDGVEYQKEKQGYSFVDWLSKQDRLNAIYVFSGLARSFLKSTFKHFKIRVHVVSKFELGSAEKVAAFAEDIIEKGNDVHDSINSLPKGKGWDKLSYYYAYHRNHPEYVKNEQDINRQAKEIIKQLGYLRETAGLMGVAADQLYKMPLFSMTPKFDNLTSSLCSTMKEKLPAKGLAKAPGADIITRSAESGKRLIWREPEGGRKRNYYREYFLKKLTARRIAWWLIFCEGLHINTVYSLLMKGEYLNNYFNKEKNIAVWRSGQLKEIPETQDAKTLIYTRLAIAKSDFPSNMLIEEKNWFKYDMGWDPDKLIDVISGFQVYFKDILARFLPELQNSRTEYKTLEQDFLVNGQFVFHHANDISRAYKLVLPCLPDKNNRLALIEETLGEMNYDDKICYDYFINLRKQLESQRDKIVKSL
jgi:hypothetical protein